MKWLFALIVGIMIWYIITFLQGVIIGFIGISKYPIFTEYSNFWNLWLYPLGTYLGFKLCKTPFFNLRSQDNKNPSRDINQHPNEFFQSLETISKKNLYKNMIETQVKNLTPNKILTAIEFEVSQFPLDSKMNEEYHEIYLRNIDKYLDISDFWKETTTYDAFHIFMKEAKTYTTYFNNLYKETPNINSSQQSKNDCFSIFQFTTLYYSYNASIKKNVRKTIGIKKGLFG